MLIFGYDDYKIHQDEVTNSHQKWFDRAGSLYGPSSCRHYSEIKEQACKTTTKCDRRVLNLIVGGFSHALVTAFPRENEMIKYFI